jgi:hypothetical protein
VMETTGAAVRQRAAARGQRRGHAGAGKQGRGREVAGEYPHPNAKLLERLFVGGEQRSGGAASCRGTMAMAVVEASMLEFRRQRQRLRLGDEELGHGVLK